MKNITLFVVSLFLFSCEKYEQPSLLTLSGTYRIDTITVSTPNISIKIGEPNIFVNNGGVPSNDTIWTPLGSIDTLVLGKTVWGINYLNIYMLPDTINGRVFWNEVFPYSEINYFTFTSIQFPFLNNTNTTSIMSLQVIKDELESIVFRKYNNSEYYIDYYLKRIGP